ncbi:MAG: hypothetical protein EXQ93_03545 [Alphaproteobacteria bacterium]|nr:hypothetical protein [Alphaproteobacteria bacterium]
MIRLLALLIFALPFAASAQGVTSAEAGLALYKADNVDCELCHGWLGLGRYHDTGYSDVTAGGPALGTSTKTREQMIEIISCGRMVEGRSAVMPMYRNDVWTPEHKCYGKVRAEMPHEEFPLPGMKQMTPAQIEQVVTFIQEVYVGKAMTMDWCRKYFSVNPKACDALMTQ